MTNIPVSFKNPYAGIVESHGLLRGDDSDLVIEYQTKYIGGFRLAPKVVRVPLTQVESVKLRRGWFGGTTLVVQTKTLGALAGLPDADQGRVELRVARRDRALAEAFVERSYE